MPTELTPGSKTALPTPRCRVAVSAGLDVTAVVLEGDRVGGDADMVAYDQPSAPGVSWRADGIDVDLSALLPGATKVSVVASPWSRVRSSGRSV